MQTVRKEIIALKSLETAKGRVELTGKWESLRGVNVSVLCLLRQLDTDSSYRFTALSNWGGWIPTVKCLVKAHEKAK